MLENDKTGQSVIVNSSDNFRSLLDDINSATGAIMRAKAQNEPNEAKRRMMLKYADRWDEIHLKNG